MNEEMRKIILDNINELVENTSYDSLVALCVEKNLLTKDMLTTIQMHENAKEMHVELFKKITTRGPKAYETLKQILKDGNFIRALNILSKSNGLAGTGMYDHRMMSIQSINLRKKMVRPPTPEYKLEPHNGILSFPSNTKIIVEKSTKIHTHSLLDVYPMKRKSRGILFLVNIINFDDKDYKVRDGAELDETHLITLFREFGFTIFFYRDLNSEDFNKYLDLLLKLDDKNPLCASECLVVAVLTHGHTNELSTKLVFKNGGLIPPMDIVKRFNDRDCPYMKDKPKIFLFPCCRGDELDVGVKYINKYQTDSFSKKKAETENLIFVKDILICYGSVPGYQTIREIDIGSWFVLHFCEILAKYAHDTDFEECLTKFTKKMMSLRAVMKTKPGIGDNPAIQTPHIAKFDFNNMLYFNPGVIEEEL